MVTVIVNGFFVGLIYALLAVGLVVVYRGARIINFAFGETGMVAAMFFSVWWLEHGWPLGIALVVALALAAAIGAVTEALVVRPLRNEPRIVPMVGTFAVASLLLVFASRRWGLEPRYVPPLVAGRGWDVAGVTIRPGQMLVLLVVGALLVGLGALYRYTSFGLRLRATAIDGEAAGQVGVNTELVAMSSWAIVGMLAAISAILIAPLGGFHVYFMTTLAPRGIAAALVGGLTSLSGAAAAGVLLGIAEGVIGYVAPVPGLVEATVAGFVIVLLLVRPSGLVRTSY